MVDICLPVIKEKIRAEVYLGTSLLAKTPYVKSFNVHKARGQQSTTFNVTVELLASTSFAAGEMLSISAGTKGNLKRIFTGVVESTQVRPVFGKPSYYSVTFSGKGVLSKLENKTFTRRLKSDGQGLFCLITSGPTNRPERFKSLSKTINAGNQTKVASSPSPTGSGEQSPLVVSSTTPGGVASKGKVEEIASPMVTGTGAGTGGLVPHTHESMEEGGPAFAVYSAD